MQQCMTTSTAGMSFNSPPATARDFGYGDGDAHCGEIMDYYNIDGMETKKQSLFTSNEQGKRNNTQSNEQQSNQVKSKQNLSLKLQQQSA
jgi:hypothetical protein